MATRPYVLLLVVLALGTSAGAIYKWVDEKGTTHYSETPPSKQKAAEVEVQPGASPGGDEGAKQFGKPLEEQEREFQRRRVQREEAERVEKEREAAAKRAAIAKKRRCTLARQNLNILETQRPVYWIDEKGEREFLDDAKRAAEVARMRQEIEIFCEPK